MFHRSLFLASALLAGASLQAAPASQQVLFNFVRPTDVVTVTGQDASFPDITAESAGGEILRRFVFNPAPQPSLTLAPQQGDWDWSGSDALGLRLQDGMDWAMTLHLRIEGADGKALTADVALPPGPPQTLLVPLEATSPRARGMRAGPPMPVTLDGQRVLVASEVEGELQRDQVRAVTLSLTQPDVAQTVFLGRFGVDGGQLADAVYRDIVDGYGQYMRGNWPEKVGSDEQLKKAAAEELGHLAEWTQALPRRDPYGGLLHGPAFEARGFFTPLKRDGRWYLVTPDGHPFFSLGVNAVSEDSGRTYVEGREGMFSALPLDGEPLAAFYGQGDNRSDTDANRGRAYARGRWYDFYRANLQRTYGPPACGEDDACRAACVAAPGDPATAAADAAPTAAACTEAQRQLAGRRWADRTLGRLRAWGFNTLGNWSDNRLGERRRMPYTLPLSISGDYATIATGHDWWGRMPDPFDPRFAMAAERAIAIATRDHRDDPWLIGYFADNELAWAAPGEAPHARYALAYGTLRLSTDVPAKRAFLKQLHDKYHAEQALAAAWGIELHNWTQLDDPGFEAPLPDPQHPQIETDLQAFQQLFAEAYFKTIADSLKWHAPNHLLLGGRFAVSSPEAVTACARYCDVLSFNFYTPEVQQGYDMAALQALDKPVLISEFHFGSRDRGPFWGGLQEVYREEERGPAYARFLQSALKQPMIVGVHWFEYLDQPATGRLLDGENGHFGLVGVTDRPWQGFVEAVRQANLAVGADWLDKAAGER
jgi:hypothetical protein